MSEKWEGALVCFIAVVVFSYAWTGGASSREGSVAEMCDTFRSFVINDVRYTCERVVP
jgi:hypothetical protein